MDRLSEAHVIREAGSRAPCSQSGRPPEPVHLIVPQLSLQGGRQCRGQLFRVAEAPELPRPRLVCIQFASFIGDPLYSVRSDRPKTQALLAVSLRVPGKIVDLLLKGRRKRNEFAFADLEEPSRGTLGPLDEFAQAEHEALIQFDRPIDAEPVSGLPNLEC